MQGIARAPGSCGELIQGTIGGVNFLVTCPVDLYSRVKVTITDDNKIIAPQSSPKASEAVRLVFEYFGLQGKGARVEIDSEIPRGKGMASSTADISAAVVATAQALGKKINPRQVAEIALAIEPSDGLMFDGITLFDHVTGKLLEYMGPAPTMEMVIVDLGGRIDTVKFNQRKELSSLNRDKETEIKASLAMLKKGFREKNHRLIAKAATISAFANQKIINKELLPQINELAVELGALGINVAHSGTVVGLFFDKGSISLLINDKLKSLLGSGIKLYHTEMVNGGTELLSIERSEPYWQNYSISMGETFARPRKNTV